MPLLEGPEDYTCAETEDMEEGSDNVQIVPDSGIQWGIREGCYD